MTRRSRSIGVLLAILMALTSVMTSLVVTGAQEATPAASSAASAPSGIDLDVLFIGAHPDDEAWGLSTYGQWHEYQGLDVGVITITRGEGGGNAIGTEEGPALGLIREQEERAAVGMAGIEHIYYLDKVDFYYTVSAPLTQATWGYDDTLSRVVRVVRETTPDVIVTMNPAPTPGNHGHHQMAARFAVAAYDAAGDAGMFPEQLEQGLQPWAPAKIVQGRFAGESASGPGCAVDFSQQEPTDVIYGVWSGTASEANDGRTWAAIEREALRNYASQGWAGFPDVSDNPDELGCDYFTLLDSRVPYTLGNTESTAILEGAVLPTTGGLPAGTHFEVERGQFEVTAGAPFDLTVTAETAGSDAAVTYELPEGWTSEVTSSAVEDGLLSESVSITPAADADPDRYRIVAELDVDGATGQNVEVVELAPPVEGQLSPLPQLVQFREWATDVGAPELDSLIKPVVSIGIGETRDIVVDVTNNTGEEQDASVTLVLAEGFTVESDTEGLTLGPNESTTVTFSVTNEDASLPTANEGGINGDYLLDIRTVASGVATTEQAGLDLVPAVTVPEAGSAPAMTASPAAVASPATGGPTLDGTIDPGEYTSAPIDLSRVWEGDEPESPADASGTAWLTWDDQGIYVAVEVTDDTLGAVVPAADAKRHWRTDTVEIAIDPLGTAENTSATFKVGVFPTTEEGGPAASRDADAYQGPIAETAPGFELASTVSEPYTGYVLETFVPYDALPAPVDPDNMAMNIFIYDSDTEDLTGQTRLGWSTYRGVQGDPYRWGHVNLEGYTLSDGGEVEPPQMPLDVARSVDSPQSILQSASDGVPLGGNAAVPEASQVTIAGGPTVVDGSLTATLQAGDASGSVHAFAIGPDGAIGEQEITIEAGGTADVVIATGDANAASVTLAYAFQTDDGAVDAVASQVQP